MSTGCGDDLLAAWLALAYRSVLPGPERVRIARGPGPDPGAFPAAVLEREAADIKALEDLGVRLVTMADAEYPARLGGEDAPLVLQVAGRADLLEADGVTFLAGHRKLGEALDAGDRTVAVLSKGMLRARSLLRVLHDPLEEGCVTLVTAEPPRASWGPGRDRRRDALLRALQAPGP